jgi:two-component system, LytTR family, sensor kinase
MTFRADSAVATESDPVASEGVPPLSRLPMTYRVVAWWAFWYGVATWAAEYLFSRIDQRYAEPFLHGLSEMVYAFYWGGAALFAVWITDRLPITSRRQYGRMIGHLVMCLAVVFVWVTLAYYTNVAIVPGWKPFGLGRMLSTVAKNVLFGYGVLLVLVHIIWWLRRHQAHEVALLRQARRATEAQLQVLKMELQPHFLFNALHSVSALIHSNPGAANDTLVLISEMLRHAVRTSRVQEVPLRDELATLKLYTDIEQVRFGDRLQIAWDVPEELHDVAVPHMLLQPLVENAIKHAVEVRSTAGRIAVRALAIREEIGSHPGLEVTIQDDGPGPAAPIATGRHGSGVGLKNTRERLAELYGGQQSFSIGGAEGGGTLVRIMIPLRRMDEAARARARSRGNDPASPPDDRSWPADQSVDDASYRWMEGSGEQGRVGITSRHETIA